MTFFVSGSNYLRTFIGWVDHKRLRVEMFNEREILEKHDFRRTNLSYLPQYLWKVEKGKGKKRQHNSTGQAL